MKLCTKWVVYVPVYRDRISRVYPAVPFHATVYLFAPSAYQQSVSLGEDDSTYPRSTDREVLPREDEGKKKQEIRRVKNNRISGKHSHIILHRVYPQTVYFYKSTSRDIAASGIRRRFNLALLQDKEHLLFSPFPRLGHVITLI